MPAINDTKRGRDIGIKAYNNLFIWRACPRCGSERWIEVSHFKSAKHTGLCDKCNRKVGYTSLRKEKHWNWKNGRIYTADGYVLVMIDEDDFFHSMTGIPHHYVREHRLVMAKHLRRCLRPWEVVHHKNGVRDDNRLENLQIIPHGRFHLVDSITKTYIRKLERRIKTLEEQLKPDILYGGDDEDCPTS